MVRSDSSEPMDFANGNSKFDKNAEEFSKRKENTVGKGEITRSEQFPLFHNIFNRFVLQTRQNKGLFGKGLKGNFIKKERNNEKKKRIE